MIGGTVARVRELTKGVQADVSIGESALGYANITVVTQDKDVMKALDGLKAALRKVAHNTIVGAQQNEIRKGRTPVGVEVDDRVEASA